jgi:hypothetical protein
MIVILVGLEEEVMKISGFRPFQNPNSPNKAGCHQSPQHFAYCSQEWSSSSLTPLNPSVVQWLFSITID